MDKNISKKTEITINVGLNKDNVPVEMDWMASDNPNVDKPEPCKAMLLSLFDREQKDTLKIDLWTHDMQVDEMDRFFYQTLRGLGDTYFKATQNRALAVEMQKFVQYFGEKTEVLPKPE